MGKVGKENTGFKYCLDYKKELQIYIDTEQSTVYNGLILVCNKEPYLALLCLV